MAKTESTAELTNITLETLNGDKNLYREVAKLTGGDPSGFHNGGIDLTGATDELKAKVAELLKKEIK